LSANELAISVVVHNQTQAAFQQIAQDAATMQTSVQGSSVSFQRLATDSEIAALGCNNAATGLQIVTTNAHAAAISLRTTAMTFAVVAGAANGIIGLATATGILDKDTAKYLHTALMMVTITASLIRLRHYLNLVTATHTATTATDTAVQTASTSGSILHTVALNIKTAATWVATAAQNALNISHATFLALTGVGIAVIIAAAAAMAYFASQMNNATASVKGFNESASGMPSSGRAIQRGGNIALYRQGVE
jgi:hypothetical protein